MSSTSTITPPESGPKPDSPTVDFRLLGPLAVSMSGKPIPLGGPKQRLVLAVLVLDANRVVSADRLIDQVWSGEPPDAARGTLHAYISRLRKLLGADRIEARSPGYVLHASRDEVDSDRFERMVAEAHDRLDSDPQAARALLDTALEMWRGPALDDLAADQAVRAHVTRLEELRLAAVGYRIEARLAVGQHAELVPELERLASEHPMREPFSASLMLALYRSDRQAEALAAFERIRQIVGDELGADPSPGLRRLHERILRQDPDLLPKGRRLRGYELMERIGEGANGVVYRAVQPTVRRDVAVKVIHRSLANQPDYIRRFEQEAQIVARLEHPHIVPLHDYWREPDGAYLVMRYLRGGSLAERLQVKGPLTAKEAVVAIEQVCSALAFAHRQGVVHRDVRPANILFDEEGNAFLSDFGIAIDIAVAGTLSRRYGPFAYYLAPEEIRSEPISPATDVYGLGLVVYEALAGRHAFGDSPSSELIDRQLTSTTPPLGASRPDLPDAAGAVIARATAKDPRDRYPDVLTFATDLREALAGGATRPAPARVTVRNPYKGLRAFEEADASDFFGRDLLTSQLIGRFEERGLGNRLVAVVGPSGSGKSSAVRAGLLPAIRRGEATGSEHWFVAEMHPGQQPFRELGSALIRVAAQQPPTLAEDLELRDQSLRWAAAQMLPGSDSELLLVVDQFEELFTLVTDERRRNAFLDMLADAITDSASRIRVVITLRADFYDRPLLHPRFGELLASRTQAVAPMRSEDIERAISGPAMSAGSTFEPGLIASMLSDVSEEPGSLPLLQYALTELFEQRTGSTLTRDSYGRMGGISGALSRKADQLYRRLDPPAKDAARELFLRLVRLGEEGSEDSRRRVLRTELAALDIEQSAVERVIEMFGNHRLLTFDRDPVSRTPTVEVAHEALLYSWRRLRDWIESGREDLRAYRRLSGEASAWHAADRDASFLLRGSRLEQVETWANRAPIALTSLERAYLDASLEARVNERAQERAREQREALLNRRALVRLRAMVAVLLIGVVVAGSLALVAQDRGNTAQREARIATARQLAAAALANTDVNVSSALGLAIQAVETTKRVDGTVLPEAEEALHAAVQVDRVILVTRGHRARFDTSGTRLLIEGTQPGQADVRDAVTGKRLSGQIVPAENAPDEITPLRAITPDGNYLVTEGGPKGIAVYDAATGKFVRQLGSYCCAFGLWITGDGKLVSTVQDQDCDGAAGAGMHLFDIQSGREVNCLPWTGFWASTRDGNQAVIATGAPDPANGLAAAVYVVDLREPGGKRFFGLDGQSDVNGAAFSGDASLLATTGPNSVMVWDAHSAGKPLFTLAPPSGTFTTAAFSDQPGLLATGLNTGVVIVWKVSRSGAEPVLRLAGHNGAVRSVAFDGAGRRLVTGSDDGLIKVWNITPASGGESLNVEGSGALDISHDGRLMAAGGGDGHVRLYAMRTGEQVADIAAHSGRVEAVYFSPDASTVMTEAGDGTVMSRVDGSTVWTRAPDQDAVTNAALSPDGSVVVVAGAPGDGVYVLDATTGKLLRKVPLPDNSPSGGVIVFSRDGKLVAVAGSDLYCYVINPQGALLSEFNHGYINALVFSPDGAQLVTVGLPGAIGNVRVYDLARAEFVLGTLKSESPVTGVAFSPDGTRIVTSEANGKLNLWDAARRTLLMTLASDATGKVAFTPDGSGLGYAAQGGFVRVLDLRIDTLMGVAKARFAESQVVQ